MRVHWWALALAQAALPGARLRPLISLLEAAGWQPSPYVRRELELYLGRERYGRLLRHFLLQGLWLPSNYRTLHRVLGIAWTSRARAAQNARALALPDDEAAPIALSVDITSRCNLACDGCYAQDGRAAVDMPREALERLARQASACGAATLFVLGGEPLLHVSLLDVARAVPAAAFVVFTNGTLATETWLRDARACGNVFPMFSLEGDESLTEKRRGRGVYAAVSRAMESCQGLRLMHGVSFTVSENNWRVISSPDFVTSVVNDCTKLLMYTRLFEISSCRALAPPPVEVINGPLRRRLDALADDGRLHAFIFRLPEDEHLLGVGACVGQGRLFFHVNVNGTASPCVFTRRIQYGTEHRFDYARLLQDVSRRRIAKAQGEQPCQGSQTHCSGEHQS